MEQENVTDLVLLALYFKYSLSTANARKVTVGVQDAFYSSKENLVILTALVLVELMLLV